MAESIGFTITMFRFVIAFLLSIPVSIVFKRFPKTVTGRHVYAIVTGFLLIYYPFGAGCFHALVTSTVVYLFMTLFPAQCGTLAWFFSFPYLIMNHVNQASGLAWKDGNLDFTGAQMVLTLKLIAVAMCYQDGSRKNDAMLHPYALSKRLTRIPSPLEYFSYLFSIGSLLSGPFYEAKDYLDYVARQGDWDEQVQGGAIPSTAAAGTKRFLKALVCACVWMYFTRAGWNIDFVEGEYWRNELPVFLRILSLWIVVVVYRFKYYAVWTVSECMMIFSGLGYRKRDTDGAPLWDRYVTSHIVSVELNPSIADTPRHWNICTGLWLRHYVYNRLSKPGEKASFFNMIVTQLVSGVWHGVFAGYWLFFATSAFIFQASRIIFKYELSWPAKWRNFYPWYFIKVIMSALVLNYAGSAFMVLSFTESMRIWKATYYFGHVWMVLVLLIGKLYPPKRIPKKQE